MAENPARFVRVSTPEGHFTVPAAVAERTGMKVLKQDALSKTGQPLPDKPRESVEEAAKAPKRRRRRNLKPRVDNVAATPTTESAADATASDSKE
jgi:hypothetical protein